jgi:hypothetical protein
LKKRIELLVKLFFYASQCKQNPKIDFTFANPITLFSFVPVPDSDSTTLLLYKEFLLQQEKKDGEIIHISINDGTLKFKIEYKRYDGVESLVYG